MTTRTLSADEPTKILLWPQGAPDAKGDKDSDKPNLTLYLPADDKANGTAVIVCPGGGYGRLSMDKEGKAVAQWLNTLGVTALVLDYRHAGKGYHFPAPLEDAQRAIRLVRTNAETWKIDPSRIGIMGFSAGGHLASTVGTHFDKGNPQAEDTIDRASCRPDFLVLCYSVISMSSEYTHQGSKKNLLGDKPDPDLVQNLSNETQVTSETPPTFLFCTMPTPRCRPKTACSFTWRCARPKCLPSCTFTSRRRTWHRAWPAKDPILSTWKDRLGDWLKTRGLLQQIRQLDVRS